MYVYVDTQRHKVLLEVIQQFPAMFSIIPKHNISRDIRLSSLDVFVHRSS